MLNYTTLLFDLDNTLINTEDYYKLGLHSIYVSEIRKLLPGLTYEEFLKYYRLAKIRVKASLGGTGAGVSRLLYFQNMLDMLGKRAGGTLLLKLIKIYWEAVLQHAKPYKGVREFLEKAKKSYVKIGVVTDNLTDIALQKLTRYGLDKYIDYLVTSEEAVRGKPSAIPIMLAIRKLNATLPQTLMIGNNYETDIKAAFNSGIASVLFVPNGKYDDSNWDEDITPDYVISSYEELEPIVDPFPYYSDRNTFIVDLTGVLIKEGHFIKNLLTPLLEKEFGLSYRVIKNVYLDFSKGLFKEARFWKKLGVPDRYVYSYRARFLEQLELDESLFDLLRLLKQKYGFHVATWSSIPREWYEFLDEKYNLRELFDSVVLASDVKARKENLNMFYFWLEAIKKIPVANKLYIMDDDCRSLALFRYFSCHTILFQKDNPCLYRPSLTSRDLLKIQEFIASTIK